MRILVFISLVILAIFYNFFLNIIINDINIFQTINEYALTEGLLLGDDLRQYKYALIFANKVAGISTTRLGAASSMPTLKEVDNY